MSDSPILDLVWQLWPQLRDRGTVDDPADLDRLLVTAGRPGAPGYDCGVRRSFECFPPDREATFVLPTGERPASDEAARFIGHVLVTRSLLAAGLAIDERVSGAMSVAYALTWARRTGEHYGRTPLELASSLWLMALDPDHLSDRPLPIDWSARCFEDESQWDPQYRLFSHYDVHDRAMDWVQWLSHDPARRGDTSVWTIVEPLLRLRQDSRADLALGRFAEAEDSGALAPAAAMMERGRIAGLLREHLTRGAD